MKLLSVAIPCYNSEAYMAHAIESLLPGGDEIEILIVNDGSKDHTAEIADEYAKKYPGIIRAVHKENGGHGDAVMWGLNAASGLYFRVVDSDDWVDSDVLLHLMDQLRQHMADPEPIDLFITDYLYDKTDAVKKHTISYQNVLPQGRAFSWAETGSLHVGQYILMHAATYRRQLLLDSGLQLPKHTFYVDNLYVYIPMLHVHRMMYLHETLYHYYIGREDQSVHENVMIHRIDQQLLVNRLMVTSLDVLSIPEPHQQRYMYSYLEIITAISSIMLILSGTQENLNKRDQLWDFIKEQNPALYKKLSHGLLGRAVRVRTGFGRAIAKCIYRLADKIVGFN